ncbi:MAG: V-type ATP synthase subunit F [Sulfolobales archaeon]
MVEALVKEVKRVVVIASAESVNFYRLLGFKEVYTVDDVGKVLNILKEVKSRKDVGVVMIEESIAQALKLDHMILNEKGLTPLITVIPNSKELLSRNPALYYRRFSSKVIGYEVGV